jgi:tetratricopeptide (TPR) repeat protein
MSCLQLTSLKCVRQSGVKLIESQFQYKKSSFSVESFDNGFKIDYSDELAVKIYDKFGGVPIALVCAVGQLAMGYELKTVLGEKAGIVLDRNLPEEIAQFCFKSSVDQLEKPSYQILLALSIFTDFASKRAILSVAGVADHDRYFVELTRRSLIVKNDLNRYSLISIVSNYMNSELSLQKNENYTKALRKNWISWYKTYVKKHGGLDWQDWRIHYDKIDMELKNIISLLNWCRYNDLKEKYESIRSIWIDLDFYIDLNGYWHTRIEWWLYLKEKAHYYSEHKTYTRALVELAWTYILMGGDKCGLAEQCLEKVSSKIDRLSLETSITYYKNFAVYCMTQKDYDKAQRYIDKSSEILNSQSSLANLEKKMASRLQVSNYYYSAEINYKRGYSSNALKEFQDAANLADQIGWQRLSNYSYNYIALIYIEQNRLREAEDILEKGLKDARNSREIRRIALYEFAFALLYEKRENYSTAINYANSCLEIFRNSLMQEEFAIAESVINRSIEHLHSN